MDSLHKYDMHIHTTFSDGQYSPNDIIKMCEQVGLDTISITDHDNIDAHRNITIKSNITVIPGIEMSAKCDFGTMHILGYNIDINNIDLINKCNEIKSNSIDRFKKIVKQLKTDYDIDFTDEEIESLYALNRRIGRVDIAKCIISKGLAKDMNEAFDNYLTAANNAVKKTLVRVEPNECIDLIHGAGGVAVLAHPSTLNLSNSERFNKIRELRDLGLDGLEVYHSDCNIYDSLEYLDYAKKLDLVVSGGSDFHGEKVTPGVELGCGRNNNLKIKELTLMKRIDL